jgi:hypothetical protein
LHYEDGGGSTLRTAPENPLGKLAADAAGSRTARRETRIRALLEQGVVGKDELGTRARQVTDLLWAVNVLKGLDPVYRAAKLFPSKEKALKDSQTLLAAAGILERLNRIDSPLPFEQGLPGALQLQAERLSAAAKGGLARKRSPALVYLESRANDELAVFLGWLREAIGPNELYSTASIILKGFCEPHRRSALSKLLSADALRKRHHR